MKDFRNVTKTIWLLVFGVVSLFLLACEDQTSDIPHTNSEFSVSMPEGVENLKVVDQTLKMTNLSTGKVTVLDDLKNVSLLEGLYDCVYSANVIYTAKNSEGEETESKGILTGKAENVEVTGKTKNISIETYLSAENDDFILRKSSSLAPCALQACSIMVIAILRYTIIPTMYSMPMAWLSASLSSNLRNTLNILQIFVRTQ